MNLIKEGIQITYAVELTLIMDYLRGVLNGPDVPWKTIISAFTIGQFTFETYLAWRQYKTLEKKSLPPVLANEIDSETFRKSNEYSKAKAKFSMFSDTFNVLMNLSFIKFDVLPRVWHLGVSLVNAVVPTQYQFVSTVAQSLCFLFAFSNLSTLMGIPLSYYSHFVLEERFGFNKLTIKLWILDMIKGNLLGYALGGPILYIFLKIFEKFPTNFLWYICSFLLVVQLLAMTLVPVYIMPLFNKFTPLEDGELKQSIEKLAADVNFPLDKIFVIDGSKRSAHSNAYFTGLPFTSKRIVLFDTLVNDSTPSEITAVLAHEIGHWQKNHIIRMIVFSQLHIFFVFHLFASVYRNLSLYNTFGFFIGEASAINMAGSTKVFTPEFPIIIGFLLFNDLLMPLECVMQFVMSLFSRYHEYQADEYASGLGYTQSLGRALITLHIKNLSTMNVDSWYSSYHHSHPTLPERLQAIQYVPEKKKD